MRNVSRIFSYKVASFQQPSITKRRQTAAAQLIPCCFSNRSISYTVSVFNTNRGIVADVIVYIFAHLHRALRTEGNMLDIN